MHTEMTIGEDQVGGRRLDLDDAEQEEAQRDGGVVATDRERRDADQADAAGDEHRGAGSGKR